MKLFNVVKCDINSKTTSVIGRNMSEEDAKKEFEEQEHLSKLFANGTYHVIQKVVA